MFEKMRKKNEAEARGSKEKSWKAVEGTTPKKAGKIRKEGGMSMEGRKTDRAREAGNMENEDIGKQGRKRKAEEECSIEKGRISKKVAAEKEGSIRRYLVGSREGYASKGRKKGAVSTIIKNLEAQESQRKEMEAGSGQQGGAGYTGRRSGKYQPPE